MECAENNEQSTSFDELRRSSSQIYDENLNGVDSGMESSEFSQHSVYGTLQDTINVKSSPVDFSSLRESLTKSIKENSNDYASGASHKKARPLYRQSSIRKYCKVTHHATSAPKAKRIPFADISNTCLDSESPKSRLESLKADKKGSRLRINRSNATTLGRSRKRSICQDEDNVPVADPSEHDASGHKRYCTALAENAYAHIDNSSIPRSARALHRVQSSSVLEISHCSSNSDENSPDKLTIYSLVTVEQPFHGGSSAFGSIGARTLMTLLESMSGEEFRRKFVLIDCRYPYEYEGGHIQNAINLYDTLQVSDFFYPPDKKNFLEINSKIPIFYCEYSQKRGPSMALALRKQDRLLNENRYPKIDYKEMYVLDRGYRNFYHQGFEAYCSPESYVPMNHKSYLRQLKHYKSQFSRSYCSIYGTDARFCNVQRQFSHSGELVLEEDGGEVYDKENSNGSKAESENLERKRKFTHKLRFRNSLSPETTVPERVQSLRYQQVDAFQSIKQNLAKTSPYFASKKSLNISSNSTTSFTSTSFTSTTSTSLRSTLEIEMEFDDDRPLRHQSSKCFGEEGENDFDSDEEMEDLIESEFNSELAESAKTKVHVHSQMQRKFSRMSVTSPRYAGRVVASSAGASPCGGTSDTSPLTLYSRDLLFAHTTVGKRLTKRVSPILEETSPHGSSCSSA